MFLSKWEKIRGEKKIKRNDIGVGFILVQRKNSSSLYTYLLKIMKPFIFAEHFIKLQSAESNDFSRLTLGK